MQFLIKMGGSISEIRPSLYSAKLVAEALSSRYAQITEIWSEDNEELIERVNKTVSPYPEDNGYPDAWGFIDVSHMNDNDIKLMEQTDEY